MATLARNENVWRLRAIFGLDGVYAVNTLHVIPKPFTDNAGGGAQPASGNAALQVFRQCVGTMCMGPTSSWSFDAVCVKGTQLGQTTGPILGRYAGVDGAAPAPGPLAAPILTVTSSGRVVQRQWGPVPVNTQALLHNTRWSSNGLNASWSGAANMAYVTAVPHIFIVGAVYWPIVWKAGTDQYERITAVSVGDWWCTSQRRRALPAGSNTPWPINQIDPP